MVGRSVRACLKQAQAKKHEIFDACRRQGVLWCDQNEATANFFEGGL